MIVKFTRPIEAYNSNGLTLGNVYNITDVHPLYGNLLLIKNDYGNERYYHKDLFIDAEFDDSGILSFMTEEDKNKLSSYKQSDVIEITNAVDNFDKVVDKIDNVELLNSTLRIIKEYPDIDIVGIYMNKINPKVFPIRVQIKSEYELERFAGKEYKIGMHDKNIRIIHKDDLFLIGKIIYFPNKTFEETLPDETSK